VIFKKFFRDENDEEYQRQNLVRFKSQKECGEGNMSYKSRDQERKTMQHIANKKPPYIDNHRLH
jgi:hypothetical protein